MLTTRLYDFFSRHKKALWGSLAVITILLAGLMCTLRFSENIIDFLPLESHESEALNVYQNISGADRIICLFSNPDDADYTVEAIDRFAAILEEKDSEGWCAGLVTAYDMSAIRQVMDFTYDNIPYFLDENDYARIDSLLSLPGYIGSRLQQDRRSLMFPSGGVVETTIAHDPLGLFSPVMGAMQGSGEQNAFELYDGYIFTPDMSRAIVMLPSPFGNNETSNNSRLVALMQDAAKTVEAEYSGVEIHITGGPVIAVGNSTRIKKDSILAVSLAAVLILLLLAMSFSSVRNILLIFLSIGWGWLFAMGGMAIFSSHLSIIVIGISSAILGIAVNYPLHLVAHSTHQGNIREAIKEITAPLVVGNITTVGAFLALVPMHSVALRDLGIFASLLLVGTIGFVLIYVPHMIRGGGVQKPPRSRLIPKLAAFCPENYRGIVAAVVLLTVIFGFFSTRTRFNSNLSDINYMTPEQRSDMAYFSNLLSSDDSDTSREFYTVSRGSDFDKALDIDAAKKPVLDSLLGAGVVNNMKGVTPFLCSRAEQQKRLDMWLSFAGRFRSMYMAEFEQERMRAGFSSRAFGRFKDLLSEDYNPRPQESAYFAPLLEGPLAGCLATLDEHCYVVRKFKVEPENIASVKSVLGDACFDIAELNNALANNLSDNFNYIGWACSLIVFFFLWFSFGSLELALISFLPMAVSWLWILGMMSLLGIQFNIVNVILATFIFGQGDDYTIFMTEGCQYEYTHGKPIMASYKSSIIQSSLIMFVGIGTLIVAKHPAMRSLAEVTIIGMFSVVLMAYLIPPLIFKWMTTKGGKTRRHPVTILTILSGYPSDPCRQVYGRYIYKGKGICRSVRKSLRRNKLSVISNPDSGGTIEIADEGYGELAILAALTHPKSRVTATMADEERLNMAVIAAADFVENIEFQINKQ